MTINVILPQILVLFCACSNDVICLLLLLLWSPRVSLVIFAVTTLISLFKKTDDADINLFPSTAFKEVNVLEILAMASNSFIFIILVPVSQGPGMDPKVFLFWVNGSICCLKEKGE